MVATPTITQFSQLYDVPTGEGLWTRESGALVWSPKDAVSWRAPVATVGALPASGNTIGDTRVVNEDPPSIWVWTSTGWVQSAGAGGVGLPPTSTVNLVIQNTEPTPTGFTINTLWINVDSVGVPEGVGTWEVYTDTSWSGDGGNLFIQQFAPVPVVDSLWVPLKADNLTPVDIFQWVVFTGKGSVSGVGNPNLYISTTLPVGPSVGSLWIPLNPDQSPKTPDQWQVYA